MIGNQVKSQAGQNILQKLHSTYPFVWIREQVPKQAVDISYKVSRKDPIHRSLGIYWPKTIPNQDLFNRCQQEDMSTKLARRLWNWIGHLLKETRSTLSEKKVLALFGTPEGKRRTRSLMVTWGRTMAA